jgi:hypothetical protein
MEAPTRLSRRNFWIIVLNSTGAYVLAYLFVFYLNHFTKAVMARMFNIPVAFDWDQLYFYIKDFQWTHDMVTTIFSSGVFLVFIFGWVAYGAFWAFKEEVSRLKIFFLWFALLAFNFFFSNLLIGNIFTRGIGYVFEWAYMTDTAKVVIAMIGFFGLILTAIILKRPFLLSANSYFSALKERNFPFFFMAQVVVPYLIGTFISVFYFFPRILFQERYSWMSLGVVLLIMYLSVNQEETVLFDPDEPPPPVTVSKVLVVGAVVTFVFLRLVLNSRHNFF